MIEELERKIKGLLKIRMVLWILAAAGCVYWIVWSFYLYAIGIHEVHEYATALRPRLYGGLIFSVICIIISFRLRFISDGYKKQVKDIKEKKGME